jgi:endonuclease/exonuclease/phosphatase family metal-dependent hydrolase
VLVGTVLAGGGCRTAGAYPDPEQPVYAATYGTPAPESPLRASAALRIVTFNVEYALRVDRALAALRDHPRLRGADLLALQEMDAPGTDTIARALGLNYVYYPAATNPKTKRDVGNAILTPWPIVSTFKLPLPHRSRILRQARAAAGAIVAIGDVRVRVYSLHLGSPFGASPGQRRDQIDVVLRDAEGAGDPVVVAGDLNSSGLGARLEAAGYTWLTRGVGPTTRGFSFDHVFAKGFAWSKKDAGVARDVKDASDHRPVWVELERAAGEP